MTGWFVFLKEINTTAAILPFTARYNKRPFSESGVTAQKLIGLTPFTKKIRAGSYFIQPREIANSDFTNAMKGPAKILSYSNLRGLMKQAKSAVTVNNRRKYIYAYWSSFDTVNHKYGVGTGHSNEHFDKLELAIKRLTKSLRGTDTTLVITADHGFTNVLEKKSIFLEEEPKLNSLLRMAPTGEPRTAYCTVKANKTREFEQYIKKRFGKCCELFKSDELVEKGLFGPGKEHPQLQNRIGDYTLLFREGYALEETRKEHMPGHHGGLSKEEMLVPLILIECP